MCNFARFEIGFNFIEDFKGIILVVFPLPESDNTRSQIGIGLFQVTSLRRSTSVYPDKLENRLML